MPTLEGTIAMPLSYQIGLFILLLVIGVISIVWAFAWIDDEFAKILTELDETEKLDLPYELYPVSVFRGHARPVPHKWVDLPPVHSNCRSTIEPQPVKVVKDLELYGVSMVSNPEPGCEFGMQGLAKYEEPQPLPPGWLEQLTQETPVTATDILKRRGKSEPEKVFDEVWDVHPPLGYWTPEMVEQMRSWWGGQYGGFNVEIPDPAPLPHISVSPFVGLGKLFIKGDEGGTIPDIKYGGDPDPMIPADDHAMFPDHLTPVLTPLTNKITAKKLGKGTIYVNNDASYAHPRNVSYIGPIPEINLTPNLTAPTPLCQTKTFKVEFQKFWLDLVQTFPHLLEFASAEALAHDAFLAGWVEGESNAEGPF